MAIIPTYPEFTPLSEGVRDHIYSITKSYPSYSDFNYVNMLAWDVANSASVSVLHGNLVTRMADYISGEAYFSYLGDQESETTALALLDAAERMTPRRELRLVPEIGVTALSTSGMFLIDEDPTAHDYVVSLPDIAAAWGKKFQIVRQATGYFDSQYGNDACLVDLDLKNPAVQGEMLRVFMAREDTKKRSGHPNEPTNELLAIGRLFELIESDKLQSYGLRVQDRLAAFMILERHTTEWSTAHFCKADTHYRGIFRAFIRRIAQDMVAQGAVHMNLEQDLGIPGLKILKNSFNPVEILKKYTVSDTKTAQPAAS